MIIFRSAAALAVITLVLNILSANAQQAETDVSEPALSGMLSNLARCDAHCEEPNIEAIFSMLQAARRLDESNYEAVELLAESLQTAGDIMGTGEALDAYTAMQPEDEVALATRISLGVAILQTSEDRRAYLWRLANQQQLPAGVRGVIYQELARLSFEAAEQENGRAFLSQAISTDEYNLAARQKMLEIISSEGRGVLPRIKLLVQMVRINPLRLQVVWDFAKGLDELGLPQEAQKWYKYALGAQLAGAGGVDIGSEEFLDLGSSYVLSKDYDKAMLVLNRALGTNSKQVSTYIWMARAASGLGKTGQAEMYLDSAEKLLLQRADGNPEDLTAVNQLAWFYLQDKPNKTKAMEWAKKAVALDADDSGAKLRMGLALLANGQMDEAGAQLEPLAENDAWARLGLVRILLAGEHTPEQAQEALGEAIGRHFGGWVGLATRELAKAQNINLPVDQVLAQVQEKLVLELGNPDELRDFYRHPQDYLYLKLRPIKPSFSVGEPIVLDISLTNMGSVAITMGPGMMVEPRLVLSAQLSGGLQRELKYYDFISLYKKRVLAPGEGLSTRLRLDRGELRQLLRACPQETVTIRLSSILDPQAVGQDEYLPSLGGQVGKKVVLVRHGFKPDAAGMDRLYVLLRDGPVRDRIRSAILLGDLLGNIQSPTAVSGARMPRAIDDQRVIAGLIEMAKASDWRVRAWLGEALRYVRTSGELNKALAEQIRDPHWFVRFMAVRAAGNRGANWEAILRRVAQTDSDELVRQMASSYLATSR